MEHDGTTTVPARRAVVWERITDPEVLTSCIMGAREVTRVDDRTYEGVIEQTVAKVTVSMDGRVRIEDLDRPERLVFTGSGSDDRTGSRMDAEVAVDLTEAGAETTLSYDVDVTFTGKLATLGARVLRRQVRANVDTYFDNLVEHVGR
jgi:carbon monoxide dehydrogenase subunit G